MSSIESPHVGSFQDGDWKKPSWWSISPLYSLSKRGEIVVVYESQHHAHKLFPPIDLLEYVRALTISPSLTQRHSV